MKFKALEAAEIIKVPNKEFDANAETLLLKDNDSQNSIEVPTSTYVCDTENQIVRPTTCYTCFSTKEGFENENYSLHLLGISLIKNVRIYLTT